MQILDIIDIFHGHRNKPRTDIELNHRFEPRIVFYFDVRFSRALNDLQIIQGILDQFRGGFLVQSIFAIILQQLLHNLTITHFLIDLVQNKRFLASMRTIIFHAFQSQIHLLGIF